MTRYAMSSALAREKAAKGHATRQSELLRVEGEAVTVDQVAARPGVSKTTAHRRLARERAKPGAVTWEGLA